MRAKIREQDVATLPVDAAIAGVEQRGLSAGQHVAEVVRAELRRGDDALGLPPVRRHTGQVSELKVVIDERLLRPPGANRACRAKLDRGAAGARNLLDVIGGHESDPRGVR